MFLQSLAQASVPPGDLISLLSAQGSGLTVAGVLLVGIIYIAREKAKVEERAETDKIKYEDRIEKNTESTFRAIAIIERLSNENVAQYGVMKERLEKAETQLKEGIQNGNADIRKVVEILSRLEIQFDTRKFPHLPGN